MKMKAINEKMGMCFEFGIEAITKVEYVPAAEAPVKNIIDLPNDKELSANENILVVWTLNHEKEEIPHVYIRPLEWKLIFE